MSDSVKLAVEGHIATITLARAQKLNALDVAMIEAFLAICDRIESNNSVRAAILTGEGKAFCAGGDVAAWGTLEPLEMWRHWTRAGHRAFDRLARLRVPLIAAVNGHALGGGLELAATADIIIVERHARIGMPETGIGMVPGWSGTQRLVRRFGARTIRRLVLTGAILSGEEALGVGIADELVETGGAFERALSIASDISKRGPIAIAIGKQLINAAEGEEADLALESLAGALTSFTDDLKEGVAGFREKRAARFHNR